MNLSKLHCKFDAVWETITMLLFWQSLFHPPLVICDGHLVELDKWEDPVYDPDLGAIQHAIDDCVRCGLKRRSAWRRWYGIIETKE